jgi:hypothetical protein
VQPFGDGNMEYLQPIWLAVWWSPHMLMHMAVLKSCIFRWLIHVSTLCDQWDVVLDTATIIIF